MTWIFTNISSISTVSFSPGVTRDVVNVWWTRERSAWAEISIRTGWIWVIGRGAGVYRISRLQQWEIMRGGAVLTSVSKDSSFVLPLWSMEPHNGDNDMHSHKLWRGDCRIPRLRFPALDTYSWNGRKEFFFFLPFPPKFFPIYFVFLFLPNKKTWFFKVFLVCLDSFRSSFVRIL